MSPMLQASAFNFAKNVTFIGWLESTNVYMQNYVTLDCMTKCYK